EHQIAEKRAVLWTKKKEKSPNEPKDEKETLQVTQENSCNETDKFRRLLGVKSSETNQIFEKKFLGNPSSNTVLNYGLDYEYEKARVKTHQNRGSGLGFYK
ncbi:MAG: Small acidic protein, partial [Paramarteilia canceri]